jgi:hypothetical protein
MNKLKNLPKEFLNKMILNNYVQFVIIIANKDNNYLFYLVNIYIIANV